MRPLLTVLTVFMVLYAPLSAFAVAVPPIEISPGCDPDFYDAVSARAEMEAEREFEAAGRLLLKPDSVLQYSCFDAQVTALGLAANTMFSDRTTAPLFTIHPTTGPNIPPAIPVVLGPNGPNPPGGDIALDTMLSGLVKVPMASYLSENFNNSFAGGLYSTGGLCASMGAVWKFLKCQDFDKDLFIALKDMPGTDPRRIPSSLPYACDAAVRKTKWDARIARAFPVPATPTALGGIDLAVDYNRSIYTGTCSSATPIPTGVQVAKGASPYDDAVCSIPGCYYDESGSGSCK